MIITLFAILTAAFLIFSSALQIPQAYLPYLGVLMTLISIATAFVAPIILSIGMSPIHQSARSLTPRLMELFKIDAALGWCRCWLFIFPFVSIIMALDLLITGSFSQSILFAVWIVALGLSFDAISVILRRVVSYQNPDFVITKCGEEAKRCIQDDRELDLTRWIDSLSEIGTKAIGDHSPSLANESINQLPGVIKNFLDASKSVAHSTPDQQAKELGIGDKISYTLFFTFQRLELLYDLALKNNYEPVCSNIIANLGKMAISCAQLDLSLASYPIIFIGKFAKKDSVQNDIGLKATYTLFEIGKSIIQETDTSYGDLKDPFLSIVSQMEALSKEAFRVNKDMNIAILTQPFKDLKELFKADKVAKHPDVPLIVQNINSVLAEFEALEVVMRTIPPIPSEEPIEPQKP